MGREHKLIKMQFHCAPIQEGTEFEEEFASAAIGINGSVVLSGYTYGSWAATQVGTENDRDFVAMSINAERDVLWTYQVRVKTS